MLVVRMYLATFIAQRCSAYALRCNLEFSTFCHSSLRWNYQCTRSLSSKRPGAAIITSAVTGPRVDIGNESPELLDRNLWNMTLPIPEMDCWRPTLDDVDRISWGKPAKKKSTGSRGVPHRLNEDERKLYDFARQKGFLEVPGSGWRKERRGAPLLNTYRNW